SCCLYAALQQGIPVAVSIGGIAADSLGASQIGELAWQICRKFVDRAVVVRDDHIRAAQKWVWRGLRRIGGPGGATAMAALLSGAYSPSSSERLGVLVCGANADLQSGAF